MRNRRYFITPAREFTRTKQNLQAARENDPEAVTTAQQMGHSSIRFMRDSCGIHAGFVLVVLRATAVRPPGPKTAVQYY